MNYQKFIIIGRMTRDPTTKQLGGDKTVCEFGMACGRKFKTQAGEEREETLFIDCEAWGKLAEVLGQHGKKGKPFMFDGRLRLDEWEDKNGGGKRRAVRLVVENFQFLGSRDDSAGADGSDQEEPPARQQARPQQQPSQRPAIAEEAGVFQQEPPSFKSEDIPF